jgi:hypothetical protein
LQGRWVREIVDRCSSGLVARQCPILRHSVWRYRARAYSTRCGWRRLLGLLTHARLALDPSQDDRTSCSAGVIRGLYLLVSPEHLSRVSTNIAPKIWHLPICQHGLCKHQGDLKNIQPHVQRHRALKANHKTQQRSIEMFIQLSMHYDGADFRQSHCTSLFLTVSQSPTLTADTYCGWERFLRVSGALMLAKLTVFHCGSVRLVLKADLSTVDI